MMLGTTNIKFITGFTTACHFAIMSQINPFHALPYFFKRYIVILSSLLRLDIPSGIFHSGFRTKSFLSSIRATCWAHLILRYRVPRNTSSEEYKSQAPVTQFSPLPPQTDAKYGTVFYEITNRCSYMQSILFHC